MVVLTSFEASQCVGRNSMLVLNSWLRNVHTIRHSFKLAHLIVFPEAVVHELWLLVHIKES